MNINFRQLTLSAALTLVFGLPANAHNSVVGLDNSVMRKDSTVHNDSIAKRHSADKAKKDSTAAKKENAYDKLMKKGGSVRNGLFTVRHIEDKWYFEVPQSITDRMLLAVTRFTSVPQAFKELPGEEVNHSTIYFEKRDDKTLLLRAYAKTQVADVKEQMAQLVEKSTIDPIVAKFDIIGKNPKTGDMLVEVSKFFVQDNNIFGLSSSDRKVVNVTALQADRSFIDTMTVYPINVEVRTLRTYSCPDGRMPASRTGFVTVGMNTSIVLLPEKPMQPRIADNRVGFSRPVRHASPTVRPRKAMPSSTAIAWSPRTRRPINRASSWNRKSRSSTISTRQRQRNGCPISSPASTTGTLPLRLPDLKTPSLPVKCPRAATSVPTTHATVSCAICLLKRRTPMVRASLTRAAARSSRAISAGITT